MAAIEIKVIVDELKGSLVSSHFKNFYELGENAFLLSLSKERKESLIYINLAKAINRTEFKERTESPTEFATQMRKRLEGCGIESVEQHNSDRIILVNFSGKSEVKLVIEMFDKGNLVLVDKEGKVELAYRSRNYRDRSIRKGVAYLFPKSDALAFDTLTAERMDEIVKEVGKSDQKLIVALAKYVNAGPLYLEETIRRAGLDANKRASTQELEKSGIARGIVALLESAKEPKPTAYEKESRYVDFAIIPISKYEKDPEARAVHFGTESELLERLYLKERTTGLDPEKMKEIEELNSSINKLHGQIVEMKEKDENYRKVAGKIFEHIGEINQLLAYISKNKIRKPEEIRDAFDNIKVKSIDLKKKTVTIELD